MLDLIDQPGVELQVAAAARDAQRKLVAAGQIQPPFQVFLVDAEMLARGGETFADRPARIRAG
jgi:hypothetical protein